MAGKVRGKRLNRKRNVGEPSEKVALFPSGHREDKTKRCCVKCRQVIKKHIFLILIIIAMAVGIGLGTGLRHIEPRFDNRQIMYLRFPGDLLLQMLQMLLIPLIVSSLIAATTSATPKSSGKMGCISLVYYLGTTTLAVSAGIALVLIIKPGDTQNKIFGDLDLGMDVTGDRESAKAKTIDTLLDLIRNLFPSNIIEATFRKVATREIAVGKDTVSDTNLTNRSYSHIEYKPVLTTEEGTNVLGIIVFSLVLGVVISKLGDQGRPLVVFFEALNMAVMKMITIVLWYVPVGIVFLIASKIVEIDEPWSVLHQLSWFIITVLLTLTIHGLIFLPLIFVIFARRNPFAYIGNMLEALITVFSTASSAATLPVTMRCLVENNNVDSRVVHFVTPVGTTANMDGSAIYQVVAAIFLAQYNGIQLSAAQVITVGITSIAASVGAAALPSGSLVVIVMVLTSVGIPTDITLIAAVDWLLDRFRGVINVEGDSLAAGVVERLAWEELHKHRVIVEHSRFGQKETAMNLKEDYYELP